MHRKVPAARSASKSQTSALGKALLHTALPLPIRELPKLKDELKGRIVECISKGMQKATASSLQNTKSQKPESAEAFSSVGKVENSSELSLRTARVCLKLELWKTTQFCSGKPR